MRWNVADFQNTIFTEMHVVVPPGARVLDLGCGDGLDAEWFANRGAEAIGVDLVESPQWQKLQRPGIAFAVGNGEALSYPDASFDVVFLKDVLHHAGNPRRVLTEAARVSKPAATIYVIEGNRFNPLLYVHMTLMLGHQHFRRPAFQSLVRQVFPGARFVHFEAHVYPTTNRLMLATLHLLERGIRTTPLVQRLAAYNGAVAAPPA